MAMQGLELAVEARMKVVMGSVALYVVKVVGDLVVVVQVMVEAG